MKKEPNAPSSGRRTTHPLRQARRDSAAGLRLEQANRTPAEQLAMLDARLGMGVGATRERAKLQKLIDGPPQTGRKGKRRPVSIKL